MTFLSLLLIGLVVSIAISVWFIAARLPSVIPATRFGVALLIALGILLASLAITGLPSGLQEGTTLRGTMLVLHVAAGGAFLALSAVAAIAWTRCLYPTCRAVSHHLPHRLVLWLFLLATLATGIPILLAMTTIFDSPVQRLFVRWHEIAAVILLAIFLPFAILPFTSTTKIDQPGDSS